MMLTPLEFPLQYAPSAGIAQLVEHNLAKVGVASSSLVSRSRFHNARLVKKNRVIFSTCNRLEGLLRHGDWFSSKHFKPQNLVISSQVFPALQGDWYVAVLHQVIVKMA